MKPCEICNDLQVDSRTNLTIEETHLSESERLLTFALYIPIQEVRRSATGGCATCGLIWKAMLLFNHELVEEVSRPQSDDENQTYVEIDGQIGRTLILVLDNLPPSKHFTGLELFTRPKVKDILLPVIGAAGEISDILDCQRCLELARSWVAECNDKHPSCTSHRLCVLPTRVLDLGPCDRPVNVKLHIPQAELASYVALSYCWGKVSNLHTTKATIEAMKAGIPWEILPSAFRDAILVTRGLGIHYLWIDSLCIVQDDGVDWEKESANMASVYENAFITIAMNSSRDPTCSCLVSREGQRLLSSRKTESEPVKRTRVEELVFTNAAGALQPICVRERLEHTEFIVSQPYFDLTYPLMSRAWATQERLLSPRILHFTSAELVWECKTTLLCECGGISHEFLVDDLADNWRGPKVTYEQVMMQQKLLSDQQKHYQQHQSATRMPHNQTMVSLWTKLISSYTARALSFESDKLPAISAMAKTFQSTGNLCSYLAGLWLMDLPWLLCWRVYALRYDERTAAYTAPTWSWASTRSPVIWDSRIFELEAPVNICEALSVAEGYDVTGRVMGGYVILTGCAQVATIDLEASMERHSIGLRNNHGNIIPFHPDQNPPSESGDETGHLSGSLQRSVASMKHGEQVLCVKMLQSSSQDNVLGLVLAPSMLPKALLHSRMGLKQLSRAPDVFERVGLIAEHTHPISRKGTFTAWFAGAQETTITII